ncbi:poly-gamma-glutamate synthesis protein (capsule biosynthesis protein) [Enhydrobacter aerosaccus]|uniref:Poly-gamma-glutamate synthesis protein (Capsule biosynthesis protein) n=1 Tax=Enhydrobacter aerosaccus TaxID=225324 RepID=A0A1T4TG11_9HYPH|nr:CapA family protein [Enhydrobacter aerosaccus]SKA39413.1 poly-gamma-glutamate synthesis protein (capsule biosynthesis protein) [Enhydrobacter aerosaccus]
MNGPAYPPSTSSPFHLLLTGDSILQRRLLSDADPVLRPLFERVRAADVAFTNLEVLANDYRGDPALESGGSHFGAPAWVLDELRVAGFDLFATATNHSLDYGVSGLLHTLEALEGRGLSFAGIGRNLEDARRPCYHTHPNGTVALISCASSFAKGQEASAQRPDLPGRPGLNPLRFETVHEVTEAQLASLREMAEQLGLEAERLQRIKMGFAFPPADPALFPLGDLRFRALPAGSNRPAVRTTANRKDVEGILRWVREARGLADLVVVSLHAHEQGESKEVPAEFIPAFAREMIDGGADLVIGHGPHLLRGLELYKGKPIFYSLGNFIGQNELVAKMPSDAYDRFRADPDLTPGQVYQKRTNNDQGGFPADRRFWESVVPVLSWQGNALKGIELIPISLGWKEARHRRGRPRLAKGDQARSILDRFAALSKPFGTTIVLEGTSACVALG